MIVRINGIQIQKTETKFTKRKFNERREEDCTNIDRLVINAAFVRTIRITTSDSLFSKSEFNFYGESYSKIDFDVKKQDNELKVSLRLEEESAFDNSNLKLDVIIPRKHFEQILVKSISSDILLTDGILTNSLKVKTQSGDVECSEIYVKNILISTTSGDVKCFIKARQDINCDISTLSGDVVAKFVDVSNLRIDADSVSGDVINLHDKIDEGYMAEVEISTLSGDIYVY